MLWEANQVVASTVAAGVGAVVVRYVHRVALGVLVPVLGIRDSAPVTRSRRDR
jgi:hypothetical protein